MSGKISGGFTLSGSVTIKETDETILTYTHPCGAVLYHIPCEDNNKVFGVAFVTPPADDTGVFHIIEHCVLCGSEKYPVREPFVNLLKTSMNTFLNAITYPDKTVYPVASTNEKDLTNLMSVYLDAVFKPNILTDRRIFMQEGWHYDYDGEKLSINGVVYNEMKGAMSPHRVSDEALYRALFPDSPYRFNSGGEPDAIPDLTYEQFLETYKKHYAPEKAVFFLSGNLDLEEKSALIGQYLSNGGGGGGVPPLTCLAGSPAFSGASNSHGDGNRPRDIGGGEKSVIAVQPPVAGRADEVYDCGEGPEKNNTYISLGIVPFDFSETEKIIALGVLDDALCGNNEAPLKKAILESGIAVDFESSYDINMLQPAYKLKAIKTDADCEQHFIEIIEDTMRGLIRNGLPKDEIDASLRSLEFNLREDDCGSRPKGLYRFLRILSSVFYGGKPEKWLSYADIISSLQKKLDSGWFEELANEVFFQSPHRAVAVARPVKSLAEKKSESLSAKLAECLAAMSREEKAALKAESDEFKKYQETPDAPEKLALLPRLNLSDLMQAPPPVETEISENGGIKLLRRRLKTSGITYVHIYFDISHLTEEELPYAAMLSSLLDELPAGGKSAQDIKRELKYYAGEWSANTRVYTKPGNDYGLYMDISYSALPQYLPAAAALTSDILCRLEIGKSGKSIMTLLKQDYEAMKQSLRSSGHMTAMRKLRARLTAAGKANELLGGAALYFEIKNALKDKRVLIEKLQAVYKRIFGGSGITVSVTGDHPGATESALSGLPGSFKAARETMRLEAGNEAFIIPGNINYTALGANLETLGIAYDVRLTLAARVLDFDYLWNEVRAKGGAYGVGLVTSRTGDVMFYSYRDPKLKSTIKAFKSAADYLKNCTLCREDIDGYIISILADNDKPVSPRLAGITADSEYFLGITEKYKAETRQRLLTSTPDDIKAFAPLFAAVSENAAITTVGNKAKINAFGFDKVMKL